MEHQLVCTVFCGCGSGSTCANTLNDTTFTTDITHDSDTDSDDDTLDLWQWLVGTQTLIITIMMMMIMTDCVYFYYCSRISAIGVHLIRFNIIINIKLFEYIINISLVCRIEY